jgi:hypothetical protein
MTALRLFVRAALACALLPLGAAAQAPPPADDPAVQAQVAVLAGWARAPELVAAVRSQNALRASPEAIQEIDAQWIDGEAEPRVQALMSNPCAEKLKQLRAGGPAYREGLVMDDQGALVCITDRTSDYWQGDEPKWQRVFPAGEVFVDRARYDTSARAILVQVSVPIKDGQRTIGVLTVGIERAKLEGQ